MYLQVVRWRKKQAILLPGSITLARYFRRVHIGDTQIKLGLSRSIQRNSFYGRLQEIGKTFSDSGHFKSHSVRGNCGNFHRWISVFMARLFATYRCGFARRNWKRKNRDSYRLKSISIKSRMTRENEPAGGWMTSHRKNSRWWFMGTKIVSQFSLSIQREMSKAQRWSRFLPRKKPSWLLISTSSLTPMSLYLKGEAMLRLSFSARIAMENLAEASLSVRDRLSTIWTSTETDRFIDVIISKSLSLASSHRRQKCKHSIE